MTALKMTVDEALALADDWIQGTTFHADSKGANAIMLVLATEVRRLRMELAHEEQRVADMMDAVNRVGHEIERLRADAERYRWLLQECYRWPPAGHVCSREDQTEPVAIWTTFEGDDVDAAIDAAMEASNAG